MKELCDFQSVWYTKHNEVCTQVCAMLEKIEREAPL